MKTGAGRWIIISVQSALTIGIFWLLSQHIDFGDLLAKILNLDPIYIMAAFAVLALQMVIVSLRLKILGHASEITIRFRSALRAILVGSFFAQTPLAVVGGDIMKAWLLHRGGAPLWRAASIVFLDRICGVVSLFVVFMLCAPGLWLLLEDSYMRLSLLMLLAFWLCAIISLFLLRFIPLGLRRFRLVEWGTGISIEFYRILGTPRLLVSLIGLGIVAHGLAFLLIFIFFEALGTEIPLTTVLILAPLPLLATLLPISIGGWGTREAAMVLVFSIVGVEASQSLTVSLLFGTSMLIASLPGAALWLAAPQQLRTPHAPAPIPSGISNQGSSE